MNKLKFFIYFLLVAIFSYCPFSSSNINSYLCNASSISTYNVNFYGSDDETVIYNFNCPAGYSLQDLQDSNLSLNSWFENTTGTNTFNTNSGSAISIVSNWQAGWGNSVITTTDYGLTDYGLNISVSSTFVNVHQYLYTNNITAGHYVLVFKGNSNTILNYKQSWCLFTSQTTGQTVYIPSFKNLYVNNDDYYIVKYLNFNYNIMSQLGQRVQIGIQFGTGSNIGLDWCYFAKAEDFFSYYNLNYVNALYKSDGASLGYGAIWTNTYNTYQPYDFSDVVTNDLNLWVDRPNVTFYASDNITPVLTYNDWSLGVSLYDFASDSPNYTYNFLIQTLLNTTKYTYDDYLSGYIDFIFNDSQLFENISFGSSYCVSNDVNIYFKVQELYFYDKVYNNYNFSVSNNDIFSSTGQNILNNISLSGVSLSYNFFNECSHGAVSLFTSSDLLDSFVLGYNFSVYVDSYNNEFYFCTRISFLNNIYYYHNYLYKININNYKHIVVPVCDYNKFVIQVGNDFVFYGDYQNVTYQINKSFYAFDFTFNYNNQNFYADYFGFRFKISNFSTSNNNKCNVYLNDVNNYFYIKFFNNNTLLNYNLLSSSYLRSYYVTDVYIYFEGESLLRVQGLNYSSNSKQDVINALNSKTINFEVLDPIIYFYQSTSDSYGSIVPTTSDALYKSDVGTFDFAGHIYNAFIYIIFDAPIISNITRIIYQIISLIIWIFNQIIALFVGTKNNIFLVAIVGFMVLKFTISLFWKKE